MIQIQRARSTEEYVDMVRQAVFEVDDLNACLEWDYGDDAVAIQRTMPFLEPLGRTVRELHQAMAAGNYRFATGEQPFMEVLRKYPDQLPFTHLLERINATHCEGLDIDGD
jgi:hypothetical protein